MHRTELLEGALTRSIIGAFYEVYNILDFGFREHVYTNALEKELRAHAVAPGLRAAGAFRHRSPASLPGNVMRPPGRNRIVSSMAIEKKMVS